MTVFNIRECVWLSGNILFGISATILHVLESVVIFFVIVLDYPNLLLQFPEHAGPCLGLFKLTTHETDKRAPLGLPALARYDIGRIL